MVNHHQTTIWDNIFSFFQASNKQIQENDLTSSNCPIVFLNKMRLSCKKQILESRWGSTKKTHTKKNGCLEDNILYIPRCRMYGLFTKNGEKWQHFHKGKWMYVGKYSRPMELWDLIHYKDY